jgi:hypothetical protein
MDMDLRKLSKMAKRVVDQRGGTDAVKADAERLKNIARGQGTLSEKGKRAAEALREPGAGREADAGRTGDAGRREEHRREEHHRDAPRRERY